MNLVGNAVKFTASGFICIRARLKAQQDHRLGTTADGHVENSAAEERKLIIRSGSAGAVVTTNTMCERFLRMFSMIMCCGARHLSSTIAPAARLAAVSASLDQENAAMDGILEVLVADSGVGIEESSQKHIFSAYAQADSSTSRKFGGTGLGLSISFLLVEMMGGVMKVQSEGIGHGSTFTFEIPYIEPPALAEDEKLTKGVWRRYSEVGLQPRADAESNLRIGLVDSILASLQMMEHAVSGLIGKAGGTILCASVTEMLDKMDSVDVLVVGVSPLQHEMDSPDASLNSSQLGEGWIAMWKALERVARSNLPTLLLVPQPDLVNARQEANIIRLKHNKTWRVSCASKPTNMDLIQRHVLHLTARNYSPERARSPSMRSSAGSSGRSTPPPTLSGTSTSRLRLNQQYHAEDQQRNVLVVDGKLASVAL